MRRTLIALVVLALAPAAGGCSPGEPEHGPGDVAFVQELLPHHREGIALARAAARDPRTRVLAEAIIVTQQDEIVRMTGWLASWGVTAPPSAAPAPSPAGDALRALADHQDEAIGIAQREQSAGRDPDAVAFAHQIVESRSEQVVRLRAIRPSAPPG